MSTTTGLLTVEEFRRLPESGPYQYELRHGQLVRMTRPRFKHLLIQRRLRQLLEPFAGGSGVVEIEIAFRAMPEHELRAADVAYISKERWDQIDPEDNLAGAPEMVIEVLSPSNTATEINDKEKLCLDHGCQEFWVVDTDLRQVRVSRGDGVATTYRSGQQIPMRVFGAAALAVDAIFQ